MSNNVKNKEFVKLLAEKMNTDEKSAESWLTAVNETLLDCFESERGVTLTHFGNFYLRITSRGDTVFRFNPSQKWRSVLGWSSNYKGG